MTKRCTLDVARAGDLCGTITFDVSNGPDGTTIDVINGATEGTTVTAPDDFAALGALRKQLARDNLTPVCFGACLYVYPSGMSRDMANGRLAYFLDTRRKATTDDLVDIFDPLPDSVPLDTLVPDEGQQADFRMALITG